MLTNSTKLKSVLYSATSWVIKIINDSLKAVSSLKALIAPGKEIGPSGVPSVGPEAVTTVVVNLAGGREN
jgi:hypothetical protein